MPGPDEPKAALSFELKALRLLAHGWGEGWEMRPCPVVRDWMSEHPTAYQCLPLAVANQWGWEVICPTDAEVTWDGSLGREGLRVEVAPQWAPAIKSQFGRGIVTFSPPWLFRTPAGWDLYVKGPSNRWKENAAPLEGVVETWWLSYTFTFNWKVVTPGTVRFVRGEPIGHLLPVPHTTFQGATAVEAPIMEVEPQAAEELMRWREERRRIVGTESPTHKLYRKAEDVTDHLVKVPVPPVVKSWSDPARGD